MSRAIWLLAFVTSLAIRPTPARGAAVLIPDHTFRLGACGGPSGPACTWQCGAGKSCAGGGTCALEGGQAFGAVLVAKADATPCGGGSGSVLSLGIAGAPGGVPFALADTAFDLCGRDVACSGRQPRACDVCSDPDPAHELCFSDDGQGNFPCPPGNVVFFCKDPCAGSGPGFEFFSEDDLNIFSAWFSETRQPLPDVIRTELPNPPATGRPVVYFAQNQLFPAGDPPVTRVCVRVAYTSQEKALGVCADAADRTCATDEDCDGDGPCLAGTPAGVNPPAPDAVVAQAACVGGDRAGRPCAGAGDCPAGACEPLAASASAKFCSETLEGCSIDGDCSAGTCIACPQPACGDGVLDPGEACDDGDVSPGDGCNATCALEPCFQCSRELGEPSVCFGAGAGASCDVDGTACTRGVCDVFGTCVDGGALTGCAGPVPEKAKLKMKRDLDDPAKAKLDWKWLGAAGFDVTSLGSPATTDDLTLCVFDQVGLRIDLTAPAGGICGKKPCWSVKPGKVQYKDKEATPDSVTKLAAKTGVAGKGKLQLGAKGSSLVLPLPLTPPVRVVAVTEGGPACFEAVYSSPDLNEEEKFKAAGD